MSPLRRLAAASALCMLALGCVPRWRLPVAETMPSTGTSPHEAVASTVLARRLGELPALTAAAAGPGGAQWSRALGWADLDSRRPATDATRFRVYSVTKALTAVLAVRMEEQGRVSLESPLGQLLPDVGAPLREATLEQLLRHTAGVRHYERGEWAEVSRRHCAGPRDALPLFVGSPLVAPPGERYSYSSFGYVLAAAALEAAAGLPFDELLSREILEPAGMTATAVEAGSGGDLATFYARARFGGVRVARPWDNSCRAGAGHLVSTAADLARFGRAALDGTLVGEAGRRRLLVPTVLPAGEASDSAMPWGLLADDDGRTLAFQSGGAPGGRAYLLLDPERGWAVALTANLEGESLGSEARALLEALAARP